jgi:hypothetical protein
MAELEILDPVRAERERARGREKNRRIRALNPDAERERSRLYARKPENRAKHNEWTKEHPEAVRSIKRRYKETNRAKYIVQAVRSEAKQKGVRFDISVAWVQERFDRGVCELSGLPFDLNAKIKKADLPSIDRRIPDGDYVESNCRLILFGLNSLLRRNGDAGVPRAVERIHELRAGA